MTGADRCLSLFVLDELGTPWYYRCVHTCGHTAPHRGTRVNERGDDLETSDAVSWPETASLNPLHVLDLHEHPQDPDQMFLDLETLT